MGESLSWRMDWSAGKNGWRGAVMCDSLWSGGAAVLGRAFRRIPMAKRLKTRGGGVLKAQCISETLYLRFMVGGLRLDAVLFGVFGGGE